MKHLILNTGSAQETEALGQRLGALLVPGLFISLLGELGGGKTCFTRGIVTGAAPEAAHLVASPTFAIMNEYPATSPIHHFDFYRFTSSNEISELGFEDYFLGNGICIAEWAERLEGLLPVQRLEVCFQHAGDDTRVIRFTALGDPAELILDALASYVNPEKL